MLLRNLYGQYVVRGIGQCAYAGAFGGTPDILVELAEEAMLIEVVFSGGGFLFKVLDVFCRSPWSVIEFKILNYLELCSFQVKFTLGPQL